MRNQGSPINDGNERPRQLAGEVFLGSSGQRASILFSHAATLTLYFMSLIFLYYAPINKSHRYLFWNCTLKHFPVIVPDAMVAKRFENESCLRTAARLLGHSSSSSAWALTIFSLYCGYSDFFEELAHNECLEKNRQASNFAGGVRSVCGRTPRSRFNARDEELQPR